jgi:hypothetical protein
VDQATAMLEIGIDYGQAPLPLVHYDADYCNVVQGRTGVILIFGKLKAGSCDLRTKIEITFSDEQFFRQLWGTSRDLHETVRKQTANQRLAAIDPVGDTDKVQCLHSNNVYMALMGGEAVLDFYYISPGDIHLVRMKKRAEVALEPVVRVVVSTPLLADFLDKCESFVERLRARFADEEVENAKLK